MEKNNLFLKIVHHLYKKKKLESLEVLLKLEKIKMVIIKLSQIILLH